MAGPYRNFPLTQREFHEQAAAIGYQPSPAPVPAGTIQSNPFAPDPRLVRDE